MTILYQKIPSGEYTTISEIAAELQASHPSVKNWLIISRAPMIHVHRKLYLVEKKYAEDLIAKKRAGMKIVLGDQNAGK